MIYAGDPWVQMPVKDLYDTQIMAMSINAAKDMYEKGLKLMEDFYTKYGDFMSPFAKDMERYGEIMNGVKSAVDYLYANGIDPIRSAEGRSMLSLVIHRVNPAEINAMKANAKIGYAYLDAALKLRSLGKYSLAQEDFDMKLNGITPFNEFATSDGSGTFNVWERTSPILAISLRELTQDSYKGRTPRTLTKEDFATDRRLKGMAFDPRYEYTGYVDSDLMKVAPGASASLAADPRAMYFRDIARQKVIANGLQPTEGNVEAQFLRDIADANAWALVDPTKKPDDFAKMDLQYRYQAALQNQDHKNKLKEIEEQAKNKDKDSDTSGGYFKAVAENAQGIRLSTLASMINNKAVEQRIKSEMLKIKGNSSYELLQKMAQKAAKILDVARKDGFRKWLYNKSIVGGIKSVADVILSLEDGQNAVTTLNGILNNFATNGDSKRVGESILEHIGFHKDENGTYVINEGENVRIVTPHNILANMIKYESNNYKGKHKLIKSLNENADTSSSWNSATTNKIASRTKTVRPITSNRGVIVAPNDIGIPTLYVKVETVSDSWFDGNHNGYWVEVPTTYAEDYGITSQSYPLLQGSEEAEGKQYGNSQRKEAYINQN